MMRRSTVRDRLSKKMALAFSACALLSLGSPLMAVSSASEEVGAHRQVSAGFGDCKNSNAGLHYGYDCTSPETEQGEIR
jgi:hypothetical protein